MLLKNYNLIALLFILLSGVYIFPQLGIRSDHIIIYFSFLLFSGYFFFLNRAIQLNYSIITILILLLLINVISLISSLYYREAISIYEIIADFENYVQPLVIILLTCFMVRIFKDNNIDYVINLVLRIYVLFLSVNVLLALLLLYIGPNEYLFLIGGPPDEEGLTTVERALSASRSGGVFAQPIDAGIAYSIGMISWLYLFDKEDQYIGNSYFFYSQFLLIIIGSILCGSKVSYVLGWGSVILYVFFFSNLYLKILNKIRFIALSTIFIILVILVTNYWDGVSALWRINQYFIYDKLIDNLF